MDFRTPKGYVLCNVDKVEVNVSAMILDIFLLFTCWINPQKGQNVFLGCHLIEKFTDDNKFLRKLKITCKGFATSHKVVEPIIIPVHRLLSAGHLSADS